MKKLDSKDKYKIELEIVERRDYNQPKRMDKMVQKNLKRIIINKLDGKMGEC